MVLGAAVSGDDRPTNPDVGPPTNPDVEPNTDELSEEIEEIVRVVLFAAGSDRPSHIISCAPATTERLRVPTDDFVPNEVGGPAFLALPKSVEPDATLGSALCALEGDQFPNKVALDVAQLMEPDAETCVTVQVIFRDEEENRRVMRERFLGCSENEEDIRTVFAGAQSAAAASPIIAASVDRDVAGTQAAAAGRLVIDGHKAKTVSKIRAIIVGVTVVAEILQGIAAAVDLFGDDEPSVSVEIGPVTILPRGPIITPLPPCPEGFIEEGGECILPDGGGQKLSALRER